MASENGFRILEKHKRDQVGVGIMIAHNPLHGSGRAALPALALGDDAHAAQGIGMTSSLCWAYAAVLIYIDKDI